MTSVRAALAADALRGGVTIELTAFGASMLPLLRAGDVLTIEPARAPELKRGDIAFVERAGGLVAHRVVATAPLVTRGDSCGGADGEIAPGAVLGRVTAFRRRGVRVRLDGLAGRALSTLSRALGPIILRAALARQRR